MLNFNFTDFVSVLPNTIADGILWGIMALGVYITYKILNVADLTVEGTYASGACVTAQLIATGHSPYIAILTSMGVGLVAGIATGILHTKCKIPAILAGILTMLALYSVNIRIQNDKANVAMPNIGNGKVETLYDKIMALFGISGVGMAKYAVLAVGIIITIIIIATMYWFFGTELGSSIRATGNNEFMVRALGANTDNMKIIGIAISNSIVALCGSLVAQSQRFADVGSGAGTIVTGLAAIIIGEVIFGKNTPFMIRLSSVVFGSVLYRIIMALILQMGLKSTDLKLLTAILVALALYLPVAREKISAASNNRKNKQAFKGEGY